MTGSIGTFVGVQAGLAMRSIASCGSEQQKQRRLPPMAELDKIGAFALTEPDHGSDSVALETSAKPNGDGYVLNGRKRWIGIRPVQVPGSQVPLEALGERRVAAGTEIVHVLAVDGLCARGHADLVRGAVVAHHRSGRVSAVTVTVVRHRRIRVGGVPPVVVVVGARAVPTTIVIDQRRVVPQPVEEGVDRGLAVAVSTERGRRGRRVSSRGRTARAMSLDRRRT